MDANRYSYIGWLAIVQVVLFPLTFIVGLIEQGVAAGVFGIDRPVFGPSDVIMIIFTIITVYVFLKFKQLLNEQYGYHDLDILIYAAILWTIMFEVIGLGLGLLMMVMWPVDKVVFAVTFLVFFAAAMVTIGVVDILIAVKLLKVRERFSEYIRAFAYVTMVAGVCEVAVFLSPLSLPLVPVTWIILALIFFKGQTDVGYV